MEILHLTASQFLKEMGTGRTRPLLLGAEDTEGRTFEVVVKLRGPELTAKAQIAELTTAPLADLLGITCRRRRWWRFLKGSIRLYRRSA